MEAVDVQQQGTFVGDWVHLRVITKYKVSLSLKMNGKFSECTVRGELIKLSH